MALLKANTGIGITNPSAALHVIGDGLFVGVVSATTFYGNLGGGVQGSVPYQSAVNTTAFLSPGTSGQVLVTAGPGQNPFWVSPSALSGTFTGITIQDEGSIVGAAASVSSLNFVGPNIFATASGAGATITIADNLVGSALSISGISTLGTVRISSGIVTATSGVVTYYGDGSKLSGVIASIAGYAQTAGIATYATSSGVSTSVIGGIASVTSLSVSGISTLGILTVGNIYSTGIITATQFVGSFSGNVTTADYATNAGIASIATYASNAGIATYATNAGVATYASNAGIATSAGIATYATNAGIATNLKGGIAGNVPYQSATNTTSFITNGTAGQVLLFNGSVPVWNDISSASGGFTGITVKDEGSTVGSASSITSLNFVGNNIVATASGAGATITLSNDAQYLTGTAPGSVISQSSGLTVTGNLFVSGNVSIGGSSVILDAGTLNIKDKDIILGITTNALNQDVSTDNTANHGGIAIASTEGTPLVDINIPSIDDIPSTYKQIMWIKSNTLGAGTTDAWIFNYAVGIGSTQVPNGVRLAAGNVQFTQNDLSVVRNINASGVITATQFVGSFTGNVTTADYATRAGIATNVLGGIASVTSLSVSGISTLGILTVGNVYSTGIITATQFVGSFSGNVTTADYATSAGIATYATTAGIATYATTAGIATNAGIATSVIGGIASVTSLSVSGISTLGIVQVSSGIITATSGIVTYYGDGSKLTGITASSIVGVTSYATSSGIATYAINAGIATNVIGGIASVTSLSVSGISTLGILTVGNIYSTGIITATQFVGSFSGNVTSANYATSAGIATYATNAGIATNVIGGIASVTSLSVSGISTLGTVQISSGIVTATTGIVTYYGDGSKLSNIISGVSISTNTTNQSQYLTYTTGTGSTTGFGVSLTGLVFNPSTNNLGIGTTNPTQSLHVRGNVRITGGLYDSNNNVGTAGSVLSSTGSGLSWIAAASGGGGISSITISTNTTNQLQYLTYAIGTGNTTGLGVTTTGLVFNPSTTRLGIGTTNPTSALTITGGDINLNDGGTYSTAFLTITPTANRFISLPDATGTVALVAGSSGQVTYNSSGIQSGSSAFTFDGSNVTLTGRLSVSGISTFTNGPVFIGAATSTGTASQRLQVTGGAYISTSTGIGTTNPTQFLHVQGNVRITGGLFDSNNNVGTAGSVLSSTGSGLSWIAAASGGGGISSVSISTSTATQSQFLTFVAGTGTTTGFGVSTTGLVFNPSTGNLGIGTTNPLGRLQVGAGLTQSVIITDIGSVGIGTTNPLQKAHILGSLLVAAGSSTGQHITQKAYELNSGTLSWEGTAGQLFSITNNLTSGSIFSVNDVSGIPSIDVDANGTVSMVPYIGNVAIGSTGVTGTSSQPLQVTGGAYVSGNLGIGTTNPLGRLQVGAGLTQSVVITGIGSVGIGTTNPSQLLHVQGNVRITGGLYDSNNNVGTAGSVLSSTGSGLSWIAAASGGGGGISSVSISTNTTNQSQYLTYVTGTGSTTGFGVSLTGLVFNPSSNNLGIGTTNPTSKLQVFGDVLISGITTTTRLNVGTGGTIINTTSGGLVGIGTTNPLFKADIAGDARITSTNKMRFGGTAGTTNFYIQYNSTTNSLDFVAG